MTVNVRGEAARSLHPPTAGLLAQSALLFALVTGAGLGVVGALAGTVYALATWVLLSQAMIQPRVRRWGPADTVTLARATLVGGVAALVVDSFLSPAPVAVLVGLAAVALLLDALDGQIARRTGTTSPWGARFDMETDAFLVLALSVFVATSLGWWVLALGVPRYLYGAAAWVWPWLRDPLPARLSRKTVAAMQGVVLVVASAGIAPAPLAAALLLFLMALLCWSFARDIGWLWQVRNREERMA